MYHHQFYNAYMEERSNKKVVSSFYFIHIMQYDTIFMIFAIIWTSPVICFPALHGSKKLSFQIELKVWACIIHEITIVMGGLSIIHIMKEHFRTYFNLPSCSNHCVDRLGLLRVYGSTEKCATSGQEGREGACGDNFSGSLGIYCKVFKVCTVHWGSITIFWWSLMISNDSLFTKCQV